MRYGARGVVMSRKGEEALYFGDWHKVAYLLGRRERFERPVLFAGLDIFACWQVFMDYLISRGCLDNGRLQIMKHPAPD